MPQDVMMCTPEDTVGEVWDATSPAACNRNFQTCAEPDIFSLSLPTTTPNETVDFLASLGTAGSGAAMTRSGYRIPDLRAEYKREIENLARGIAERAKNGMASEELARWASGERLRIVKKLRSGEMLTTRALYEIRDWSKYGYPGRTFDNMTRYYNNQGIHGEAVFDKLIDGAARSNAAADEAALRGARFLRHGGKVVMVVGVAVSAARIWNASEEELPRVIGEEVGGLGGGALGAGLGVGACILFGIATSGWGLLACGVVGGGIGGVGGSYLGGETADLLFSDVEIGGTEDIIIEIPENRIFKAPPPRMCMPH
jgi:hypothetical protein